MPIISERIVNQEFARIELEKYRSRRIDRRHSIIPIAFLFSAYVFLMADYFNDYKMTIASVIIFSLFIFVLLIFIFAKSLEQDWRESILTKISMARFEIGTNYPLLRGKKWIFDNYDWKYIYTDSRLGYFVYQTAKYFCYAISYPIIVAIGVFGVISQLFPGIFTGN